MLRLLQLVVPPSCGICASPCPAPSRLCATCESALAAAPAAHAVVAGVDQAWAATAYDGTARALVAALKFRARPALAVAAAQAIASRRTARELRGPLVPVPADPLRRRLRGFDPAGEIATALGAELGLDVDACLCRRAGRRQVGRPRAARLTGPAVSARPPVPRSAVLVDDVITTGATLSRCAEALRDAGCARVLAVAFARA